MKYLHVLLLPLFLFCTSFHPNVIPASESEASVKLARQVSKLLGVTVKPEDVKVLPIRKIQSWVGIPSFIFNKLKTGEYSHFVYAEFTFHEDVSEIVLRVPQSLREKYGADFIIAVNQNSSDEQAVLNRCEAKRCDLNGNCRTETFLIEGTHCVDMCSTSEQCQQPCFVGVCENGICRPAVVYSKDCGSIPNQCLSMLDCPESGTDTSCEYKMCTIDGYCWDVSIQINSAEQDCPSNECSSDEDCVDFDFGEDAGLLGNIKEVYGY